VKVAVRSLCEFAAREGSLDHRYTPYPFTQGRGQFFLASQGAQKAWAMQREHLSPAYTTRWNEIPKVR
jgi:hypothetical protein